MEKGKDKDNEHNYVADAQNWEARVKGELESARVSPSIENLHSINLPRTSSNLSLISQHSAGRPPGASCITKDLKEAMAAAAAAAGKTGLHTWRQKSTNYRSQVP